MTRTFKPRRINEQRSTHKRTKRNEIATTTVTAVESILSTQKSFRIVMSYVLLQHIHHIVLYHIAWTHLYITRQQVNFKRNQTTRNRRWKVDEK